MGGGVKGERLRWQSWVWDATLACLTGATLLLLARWWSAVLVDSRCQHQSWRAVIGHVLAPQVCRPCCPPPPVALHSCLRPPHPTCAQASLSAGTGQPTSLAIDSHLPCVLAPTLTRPPRPHPTCAQAFFSAGTSQLAIDFHAPKALQEAKGVTLKSWVEAVIAPVKGAEVSHARGGGGAAGGMGGGGRRCATGMAAVTMTSGSRQRLLLVANAT